MIELGDHQIQAINKLRNGCVLNADVGIGKSRTAIAYYYFRECGGEIPVNGKGVFKSMTDPKDLYIITTAKKRDTLEWEDECAPFQISKCGKFNQYGINLVVDSWNNIRKYTNVCNAFFIFDEQRVTGSGPWVRAFYAITKKNHWILLTATPGDNWLDYIPLFVANGFYRNKTDFLSQHAVYARFYNKYSKVVGFRNEGKLLKLRSMLLVDMEHMKPAEVHDIHYIVDYDKGLMRTLMKNRWNVFDNEPVRDAAQLCYLMRRVANTSKDRINKVKQILGIHPKVIIFYNFDYELELLRSIAKELKITKAEWNGHMHQPVPKKDPKWMYLVQYTAGAEGWNCIDTNALIFYSQSYSYKTTVQAAGRINRMNTPFSDLYYYHLRSVSGIDLAITKALNKKKEFNQKKYIESIWRE